MGGHADAFWYKAWRTQERERRKERAAARGGATAAALHLPLLTVGSQLKASLQPPE